MQGGAILEGKPHVIYSIMIAFFALHSFDLHLLCLLGVDGLLALGVSALLRSVHPWLAFFADHEWVVDDSESLLPDNSDDAGHLDFVVLLA